MPGRYVIDASVAAKLYFTEAGSNLAETVVRAADRLIAPDLLFLEMASIAAKNVRRAISSLEQAADAVDSLSGILDETVPLPGLAGRAFQLAHEYGFSAYDGAYLALAEAEGIELVTADEKLVRRAREANLSHLVRPLA
jgi:predicted nucleic acid-binding protein